MNLVLLAIAVFVGSYCLTAGVLCALFAIQKARRPLPAYGWPDAYGGEGEARGDEQEHQGEDVQAAKGDTQEPEQGEDCRGDVADEGDHGRYIPGLKGS